MMIITIIISVVAILELIWAICLCKRISFIKWSHNYWVESYFQEVDKRIDFECQVELGRKFGGSDMEKFEYKKYNCDDRDLNSDTLNEFGREGWDLVTHSTVAIPIDEYRVSVWHYFFFRRPLVPTE